MANDFSIENQGVRPKHGRGDDLQPNPAKFLFDRNHIRKTKQAAVLRAAAQAFNERGFNNTTLDDVASALNISKPTLYLYFPSKQKILFECHQQAMNHGEAALQEANESGKNGFGKFEIFTRRYMMGIFDDFGACTILADVDSMQEEDRETVRSRRKKISHATLDILEEGIADGSMAQRNAKLATLFALGAINWAALWYRPNGASKPDEIIDEFLDLFRHGLARRG